MGVLAAGYNADALAEAKVYIAHLFVSRVTVSLSFLPADWRAPGDVADPSSAGAPRWVFLIIYPPPSCPPTGALPATWRTPPLQVHPDGALNNPLTPPLFFLLFPVKSTHEHLGSVINLLRALCMEDCTAHILLHKGACSGHY